MENKTISLERKPKCIPYKSKLRINTQVNRKDYRSKLQKKKNGKKRKKFTNFV